MQHKRLIGLAAGVIAGISYGTNPLFAKPLLESGVPVLVMLFYRYSISTIIMALWMLKRKESFKVNGRELRLLSLLGILFASSSFTLFVSYNYIPSGLATTIIYLYPVLVALIMVTLKSYPSWQTWVSIVATFVGIIFLTKPSGTVQIQLPGILLAIGSALCYALYLVIVNRSRRIKHVTEHSLTFYALLAGTLMFAIIMTSHNDNPLQGIDTSRDVLNLIGLAVVPTMISMLSVAISTRYLGPAKTSVLGVFEPLTAIMIGTVVFNEPLTAWMAVGIAICTSAVVFMVVCRPKEHIAHAPAHVNS